MRKVVFTLRAKNDLDYFEKYNYKLCKRIIVLIEAILQDPFSGIGKPEALKHNLTGYYSRRINKEHRLVYKITDNLIQILSCRFHY